MCAGVAPRPSTASRLAYGGLLALMVAAPFESATPLFQAAGLELTAVELVLASVLLLWLAGLPGRREDLHFGSSTTITAAFLLLAMLLSAWMAAPHAGEALRFCGRFAAGLLVYIFVRNEIKSSRRLTGLMTAALCTGTVVAVLGVLEYRELTTIVNWLSSFKSYSIYSAGQLRASSTLQYPTIASMYLEITFGLGVGLMLYTLARSRMRLTALIFVCLLIMWEGILATQTRTGLLVISLQLAAGATLYWRFLGLNRGFGAFSILVLGFSLLAGHMLFQDPTYWLRLTTYSQNGWYRARFEVPETVTLAPGELQRIPISITNIGKVLWTSDGEAPFRVSYHWLQADGDRAVIFDGYRTALPKPVRPGEQIAVEAWVLAPPVPGRYRLAWDILQEKHGLWFSTEESLEFYSSALVDGPAKGEVVRSLPLPELRFRLDRFTLWSTAAQMFLSQPLLGVGPDNFRLLYGRYLGLETSDYSLHSNNMYLEFFVGSGLIGGILFLALIASILTRLKRASGNLGTEAFPLFLGIVIAVMASLVHGLFDYFLTFTPTYIMIWAMWGAAGALGHRGKEQSGGIPAPMK